MRARRGRSHDAHGSALAGRRWAVGEDAFVRPQGPAVRLCQSQAAALRRLDAELDRILSDRRLAQLSASPIGLESIERRVFRSLRGR